MKTRGISWTLAAGWTLVLCLGCTGRTLDADDPIIEHDDAVEDLRVVAAQEACEGLSRCGDVKDDCVADYAEELRSKTDVCVEYLRAYNACLEDEDAVCWGDSCFERLRNVEKECN